MWDVRHVRDAALDAGMDAIAAHESELVERLRALEYQAILVSLENLMTFPFVREAVEQDLLSLHGLWTDIGEGGLHQFEPVSRRFSQV